MKTYIFVSLILCCMMKKILLCTYQDIATGTDPDIDPFIFVMCAGNMKIFHHSQLKIAQME